MRAGLANNIRNGVDLMSISDADFIRFYQEPLISLSIDPDSTIQFLVGFPQKGEEKVWYEQAIAALTRLGMSGLISCYDAEDDIRFVLRIMFSRREEDTWLNWLFSATDFGEELAKKFYWDDEVPYQRVVPGFREELGRIFDEHGVGLDIDLPYDELFMVEGD